jgi:uncharacterized protein YjiS (DUF1127 family)
MITISALPALDKLPRTNRAAAAVWRWWLAFHSWRIERSAISQLLAMSDCELKDIGIGRSEVETAVSTRHARSHARST